MDNRSLDRALDVMTGLLNGEEIRGDKGGNIALYEEYMNNPEVYQIVRQMVKKMNLNLYEYGGGLYLTAGDNNRVFGYTNEELRKLLGVRLNRELFLCYFIIYIVMTRFYTDSGTYNFVEYIKADDVIQGVTEALSYVTASLHVLVDDEVSEESFQMMARIWGDMPVMSGDDQLSLRSSRNSQAGYVKRVLNFLVEQELLIEADGRYYPKDRLRAVTENYFEEYKGKLYRILSRQTDRKEEAGNAIYKQDTGE